MHRHARGLSQAKGSNLGKSVYYRLKRLHPTTEGGSPLPTFLFHLRIDTGELPFVAGAPIVDPIVTGYRGVIRRFRDASAVVDALEAAGISADRYEAAVAGAVSSSTTFFEISLNEAQNLSLIQTDTTK
jgi:hypothetical protein